MEDEDREAAAASPRKDQQDAAPDAERAPDDAQPERVPDRRPVHALGAVGCLTMALAALAGIALLATGNFFAGLAGIIIVAVAIGVGLWLYTVVGSAKK